MARTTAQIYDVMAAEKTSMVSLTALEPDVDDAQTLLTDIKSPSKVAHWRLMLWLVAYGIHIFEGLMDLFKSEVDAKIEAFRPGTLRWYQEQAFAFQYGHELVWSTLERKYYYATSDEAAKVVKLCSVTEPGGIVRVKVATLDGVDVVAVASPQLAALQAYFNLVKYPGKLVCVSYDADLLKIYGTVKFNPLVDPVVVTTEVEAAINGYVKGLEFNGRFNVTMLKERVMEVTGVEDFVDIEVYTKYGLLAYQLVDDEYQTFAGYCEVDPAFPLSTTLTSVPYV